MQEENQGTEDKNKKVRLFVSFLLATITGLVVYTIIIDAPDLVRGTKSIKTISIFKQKQ